VKDLDQQPIKKERSGGNIRRITRSNPMIPSKEEQVARNLKFRETRQPKRNSVVLTTALAYLGLLELERWPLE
jgi:uncharacterized membrane protein YkvA (DUF1232 family)